MFNLKINTKFNYKTYFLSHIKKGDITIQTITITLLSHSMEYKKSKQVDGL